MLPFDEAGEGPAVVLLHAGVADRRMWRDQLEPLASAGYRVIAPDLPGFGDAPVPPGEQAPWVDVLATIDAAGIERAALVGSSFGGAVALRVAAVAPERLWALALISAPPPDLEPSAELRAAWEAEETALERGDVEAAAAAVADAWVLPDAPAGVRDLVMLMQRRAFELQTDAPEEPEAPDPAEDLAALAAIDVPALVAAGEHDMSDFRDGASRMADALPRVQHSVIAGAGHLAPLETPESFRELVLAFLRKQREMMPNA